MSFCFRGKIFEGESMFAYYMTCVGMMVQFGILTALLLHRSCMRKVHCHAIAFSIGYHKT